MLLDKILAIAIMALVTYLIRLGPFLLFGKGHTTPPWVQYMGKVLPPAVMGMLIVYSLKTVEIFMLNSVAPVLVAIFTTAILHLWKRNNLLSILSGTAVYMFMIQVVFAVH
jgi:branched-subunit amino acid transport protein AzlD